MVSVTVRVWVEMTVCLKVTLRVLSEHVPVNEGVANVAG